MKTDRSQQRISSLEMHWYAREQSGSRTRTMARHQGSCLCRLVRYPRRATEEAGFPSPPTPPSQLSGCLVGRPQRLLFKAAALRPRDSQTLLAQAVPRVTQPLRLRAEIQFLNNDVPPASPNSLSKDLDSVLRIHSRWTGHRFLCRVGRSVNGIVILACGIRNSPDSLCARIKTNSVGRLI